MSTLQELTVIGENLNLSGKDLRDFIREQQSQVREERMKDRQLEKERRDHELQKERLAQETRLKERELDIEMEKEKIRSQVEIEREKCKTDIELGKAEAREAEIEHETKSKIEVEKEQLAVREKDLELRLQFEKDQAEIKREQIEHEMKRSEHEMKLKRELEQEQAVARERERDFERELARVKQQEMREKLELLEKETELRERYAGTGNQGGTGIGEVRNSGYMKGPKLPFFDESKDQMDSYIQRFERVALAQKWKRDIWAANLSSLLRGRSLDVYSRLTPEEAQQYDVLKLALLKRFDVTEEGYKKKFRTTRPEAGETFQQFTVRLSNYCTRWMELSETNKTFEDLFDLLIREQFLQSCSRDLAVFLKERKPESAEEMAKLADQFREARGGNNASVLTHVKPVHEKSQNTTSLGGRSQMYDNKFQSPREASGRRCFYCSGFGHISKYCPSKRQGFSTSGNGRAGAVEAAGMLNDSTGEGPRRNEEWTRGRPFNNSRGRGRGRNWTPTSGGPGNWTPSYGRPGGGWAPGKFNTEGKAGLCISFPTVTTVSITQAGTGIMLTSSSKETANKLFLAEGKVGTHTVTVLRDTGCSGVVVRRNLVRDEQLLSRTQTCTMINGDTLEVPVAWIEIDTPYFSGGVEAWCMNTPIYDLVVGNISGVRDSPRLTGEAKQHGANTTVTQTHKNTKVSEKHIENNQGRESAKVEVKQTHEHETNAVQTRAQTREEEKPYRPLKVAKPIFDDITPDEFKAAQQVDSSLSKLRDLAKSETVKEGKGGSLSKFSFRKGFLCREFRTSAYDMNEAKIQYVVPKSLRDAVMKLAHETIMSGHQGTKRTAFRVMSEFFWPGVQADVGRYCKSCDVCQKTIKKGSVKKVPLGQMPIIDIPFQRVAVDIVGPIFPATDRGKRYILTIVDYATRYPEAVPLERIDTERVAEALVQVYSRVGVPREMLTDMGSQFTSDLMKEVSRLLSLRQLTTTPYHAQCNGLVERFNGTLKTMLKRMCRERPKDWDKYVDAVLFAYREVPQESTGYAPFELLYGRTVRGPMQILRELWTKEIEDPDVKTTYQYVLDLKEKLEDTCQMACENVEGASRRYAKYYNRNAKERQMQVGDRVLVLLPTNHNKLLLEWKGPFEIVRKVNVMDYRIDMNGTNKTFHANMLKRYFERGAETVATLDHGVLSTVCVSVLELEDNCDEDREIEPEGYTVDIPTPTSHLQQESYKDVHVNPELTQRQQLEVKDLLREFPEVLTDLPGRTNLAVNSIKTTTEEPVRRKYPLPYKLEEIIQKEVESMLKLDIIEPSESPYSSPVVIIKKKDGANRFCVDYRQINKITIFDAEPMPNIEDMFAKITRNRYYSKMDLCKGYWQVAMTEDSKQKTAFTTPQGLYQFKVMPFGLVNAPATFSRMMRKLLDKLDGVDNFMDDVLVATLEWEEQLQTLRELLTRLSKAKLTAKPSKCFVGYFEIECLGHILGSQRLSPQPDKVKAILEAKPPTTKTQVKSFLGLAGFYRKFIPNFSAIAAPLSDLTKKGKSNNFQKEDPQTGNKPWGDSQERSFEALKKSLSANPILKLPNLAEPFILRTDASDRGLGAVLLQEEGEQKLPVAYASRKLLQREQKYATVEKECLGLVWAITKFQRYLYGSTFTVETDHEPLTYLNKAKITNPKLMRWALALQPYRFRIQAIKGSDNIGADYLSRS